MTLTTKQLLKLKEKLDYHKEMKAKTFKALRDNCHHPKEHLENKSCYISATYDDPSYTEYWEECKICGFHLNCHNDWDKSF